LLKKKIKKRAYWDGFKKNSKSECLYGMATNRLSQNGWKVSQLGFKG